MSEAKEIWISQEELCLGIFGLGDIIKKLENEYAGIGEGVNRFWANSGYGPVVNL